jgi:hypothetical protein
VTKLKVSLSFIFLGACIFTACTSSPLFKEMAQKTLTDERKPQSAARDFITHFDQPEVLDVFDQNAQSPLSLVQIFKLIHQENNLPLPALSTNKNSGMNKFTETYSIFASTLSTDINRITTELGLDWEKDITKTYVTSAAKTSEGKIYRGNGNVTRVFNEKWLTSSDGQFVLSGIINRIDRMHFDTGTCGEIRFLYRLGYQVEMGGESYASRAPFTLNVVFEIKNDGRNCQSVAEQWRSSNLISTSSTETANKLLNGPLNFAQLKFKQMEVNGQIARVPSDLENVTGRKFAGQAIYWMRIFAVQGGKFQPQKLENTPDVIALQKDSVKKEALKNYLIQNMTSVDKGVYKIPDEYLSTIAISYSTAGSSRLANRPFDSLFKKEEADEILKKSGFQNAVFANSGGALLERLNTSTCMGCHQTASTAGFHFLGRDRFGWGNSNAIKSATDGNRLAVAFSPHFYADISRRQIFLNKLSQGDSSFSFRPHPAAPPLQETGQQYNTAKNSLACIADNKLSSGSNWTCGAGSTCQVLSQNASTSFELGQCIPAKSQIYSGLSCRSYKIENHMPVNSDLISYNILSYKDKITDDRQLFNLTEGPVGADYNCRPTRIGVPHGRVTRACKSSEMNLQSLAPGSRPNEICAVVGGKAFEQMAKGYFNSKKFAEGVGRGMLNTCGPDNLCSEDYICQEIPDFLQTSRFGVKPDVIQRIHREHIGYCTPTYFVYQLRLDGHPNPR